MCLEVAAFVEGVRGSEDGIVLFSLVELVPSPWPAGDGLERC